MATTEQYKELLDKLDKFAKGYGFYDFGLPLYDETIVTQMCDLVQEWEKSTGSAYADWRKWLDRYELRAQHIAAHIEPFNPNQIYQNLLFSEEGVTVTRRFHDGDSLAGGVEIPGRILDADGEEVDKFVADTLAARRDKAKAEAERGATLLKESRRRQYEELKEEFEADDDGEWGPEEQRKYRESWGPSTGFVVQR